MNWNPVRIVTRRQMMRDGEMLDLPVWMGVAWDRLMTREVVFIVIPFNWIVALLRRVWLWIKYVPSGAIDQLRDERDAASETVSHLSKENMRLRFLVEKYDQYTLGAFRQAIASIEREEFKDL